jgi:hypothetical protein
MSLYDMYRHSFILIESKLTEIFSKYCEFYFCFFISTQTFKPTYHTGDSI